ncbi:hypothetical protein BDV36DRAFT_229891 [Aspergillus pseudocaelatus]|uniref:Uncharacterized protein n=1 Tax=Aspergillus pseudocaelatus TaxID=1825620 RepID=A0ABQ6WCW3_9EURO|nr:hypothetical protein BDV36DRAFT_229891 [Aspergillus pseudocaelatus]
MCIGRSRGPEHPIECRGRERCWLKFVDQEPHVTAKSRAWVGSSLSAHESVIWPEHTGTNFHICVHPSAIQLGATGLGLSSRLPDKSCIETLLQHFYSKERGLFHTPPFFKSIVSCFWGPFFLVPTSPAKGHLGPFAIEVSYCNMHLETYPSNLIP